MRIVTWNVNSLKARLGRVEAWLAEFTPDVVCLQETKLADDAFPHDRLAALGYTCLHHGEGRWNGVAICSRVGLDDPVAGFASSGPPDTDARIAWATCGPLRVASVYVPNGREVGHDHYRYKLEWLERLRSDLDECCDPDGGVVVCGDFNIAPDDRDVHDPAAFDGATHVTPDERSRLAALYDWGLVDLFRTQHDEDGLYTWWDYRGGDFHKRKGMRIDLVLGTRPVADAVTSAVVDRNARKGGRDDPPSDHAPVIVDLDCPDTT